MHKKWDFTLKKNSLICELFTSAKNATGTSDHFRFILINKACWKINHHVRDKMLPVATHLCPSYGKEQTSHLFGFAFKHWNLVQYQKIRTPCQTSGWIANTLENLENLALNIFLKSQTSLSGQNFKSELQWEGCVKLKNYSDFPLTDSRAFLGWSWREK